MFHHFHGGVHPKGQGAIDVATIARILDFYGDRVLSAQEWADRAMAGRLDNGDVCLTFDDALLCQFEIALPVLKERGLTAFWFVYSSVFQGGMEPLEIFRYFRTVYFADFGEFFHTFMAECEASHGDELRKKTAEFDPDRSMTDYPFYS
jgi:hypothetical protein